MSKVIMGNGGFYSWLSEPQGVSARWKEASQTRVFLLSRSLLLNHLKGPLKYLVAKLHGCYPGANSLPVSQNFFARFFRRRTVADSSRCLTFLLRCNKHKKHFLLTFFLLMFFFTVTTCEWCLYFLNLAVLLENFIHVRAY